MHLLCYDCKYYVMESRCKIYSEFVNKNIFVDAFRSLLSVFA